MEKKELKELIEGLFESDHEISDDELECYHRRYIINGKAYNVYLAGTDDMFGWDGRYMDSFYQVGIDPVKDKAYRFFFATEDVDCLDCVDYDNPYEVMEAPEYVEL